MSTRHTLIRRIEAFIGTHGLSEREFGLLAVNDHKFMRDLRGSRGVTLRRIERAEGWMQAVDDGRVSIDEARQALRQDAAPTTPPQAAE